MKAVKTFLLGLLALVVFLVLLGGIFYMQFEQDNRRQAELKALPKVAVPVPSPRGVDQMRIVYLSPMARQRFSVDDWRAVVADLNPGDLHQKKVLMVPTDE